MGGKYHYTDNKIRAIPLFDTTAEDSSNEQQHNKNNTSCIQILCWTKNLAFYYYSYYNVSNINSSNCFQFLFSSQNSDCINGIEVWMVRVAHFHHQHICDCNFPFTPYGCLA